MTRVWLTLLCLCMPLAAAMAAPGAKGLMGYEPEMLPPIAASAQIRLGWRTDDTAKPLDEDPRRQLIAELNALRAHRWARFDGKAGNPVVVFRVAQRGAADLWFTLTPADISQLRHGPSLTAGGHAIGLNLQNTPGLRALLDAARP